MTTEVVGVSPSSSRLILKSTKGETDAQCVSSDDVHVDENRVFSSDVSVCVQRQIKYHMF